METNQLSQLQEFFGDIRFFLQGLSKYNARINIVSQHKISIDVEMNTSSNEQLISQHLESLRYIKRKRDSDSFYRKCQCSTCQDQEPCIYDETNYTCSSCCRGPKLCKPLQFVVINTVPVDELSRLADGLCSLSVNEDSISLLMDGLVTMNL